MLPSRADTSPHNASEWLACRAPDVEPMNRALSSPGAVTLK